MSKMSRQDFQLIAATIATLPIQSKRAREWELNVIACAFADALAPTNPAFNRALFIQAATGVVPVTARKARASEG